MKRPRWYNRKLLLSLAILVGLCFVYWFVRDSHYEWHLAATIAQLNAKEPGWDWESRLTQTTVYAPPVDAGEEFNAIVRLLGVDEFKLQRGRTEWEKDASDFESDRFIWAVDDYYPNNPTLRLPQGYLKWIAKLLSQQPAPTALARVRNLHRLKVGRLQHQYQPFLMTSLLPHIQPGRVMTRFLTWQTYLDLEAGQPERAAENIRAMLSIARLYEHDPFVVTMMVRMAIVQQSCRVTQRFLAQTTTVGPPTLRQLQQAYEQEAATMIPLPEVYRWQRAIHDHDLRQIHEGHLKQQELFQQLSKMVPYLTKPITGWKQVDTILRKIHPFLNAQLWGMPSHWAYERSALLKYYSRVIAWSQLPEHELLPQLQAMRQSESGVTPFMFNMQNTRGTREAYQEDSFPELRQVTTAWLEYHARVRCIIAALAAEQYRLQTGQWPGTCDQLVPQFLDKALLDPFTGKPLQFSVVQDGLVIYSIGRNQIDDGGVVFPLDRPYLNDLGVKLWNVEKRRQIADEKAIEEFDKVYESMKQIPR